jgi:hypothetical protein
MINIRSYQQYFLFNPHDPNHASCGCVPPPAH